MERPKLAKKERNHDSDSSSNWSNSLSELLRKKSQKITKKSKNGLKINYKDYAEFNSSPVKKIKHTLPLHERIIIISNKGRRIKVYSYKNLILKKKSSKNALNGQTDTLAASEIKKQSTELSTLLAKEHAKTRLQIEKLLEENLKMKQEIEKSLSEKTSNLMDKFQALWLEEFSKIANINIQQPLDTPILASQTEEHLSEKMVIRISKVKEQLLCESSALTQKLQNQLEMETSNLISVISKQFSEEELKLIPAMENVQDQLVKEISNIIPIFINQLSEETWRKDVISSIENRLLEESANIKQQSNDHLLNETSKIIRRIGEQLSKETLSFISSKLEPLLTELSTKNCDTNTKSYETIIPEISTRTKKTCNILQGKFKFSCENDPKKKPLTESNYIALGKQHDRVHDRILDEDEYKQAARFLQNYNKDNYAICVNIYAPDKTNVNLEHFFDTFLTFYCTLKLQRGIIFVTDGSNTYLMQKLGETIRKYQKLIEKSPTAMSQLSAKSTEDELKFKTPGNADLTNDKMLKTYENVSKLPDKEDKITHTENKIAANKSYIEVNIFTNDDEALKTDQNALKLPDIEDNDVKISTNDSNLMNDKDNENIPFIRVLGITSAESKISEPTTDADKNPEVNTYSVQDQNTVDYIQKQMQPIPDHTEFIFIMNSSRDSFNSNDRFKITKKIFPALFNMQNNNSTSRDKLFKQMFIIVDDCKISDENQAKMKKCGLILHVTSTKGDTDAKFSTVGENGESMNLVNRPNQLVINQKELERLFTALLMLYKLDINNLAEQENVDSNEEVKFKIGSEIKPISGNANQPNYFKMKLIYNNQSGEFPSSNVLLTFFNTDELQTIKPSDNKLPDPVKPEPHKFEANELHDFYWEKLLMWAVVTGKEELAEYFLGNCRNIILMSLVAASLCRKMRKKCPFYETNYKKLLKQLKENYENIAIGVISEAHSNKNLKPKLFHSLQERHELFSNKNCIDIAVSAKCKRVLVTDAFGNMADCMWYSTEKPTNFTPGKTLKNDPSHPIIKINKFPMYATLTEKSFRVAPITKYAMNLIVFMAFLIFYAVVTLQLYEAKSTKIGEGIIFVWIVGFAFEEALEFTKSILAKTNAYIICDNSLEFLNILIGFVAFILGINALDLYAWAVFFYWLNGILLIFRLLRELAAFKKLGPRLIMMIIMMKRLREFAFILIAIIAMFSFTYSIFPTEGDEMPFFKPFFLIGDMLYEYDEVVQAKQVCFDSRNAGNSTGECTKFAVKAGTSLVFIYIVNLMLINFLIALFSSVYERFSEKSDQLWRLGFYRLVEKYIMRPILPSPFCIAEVTFYSMRALYRKCKNKKVGNGTVKEKLQKLSPKEQVDCYEEYKKKTKPKESQG